MRLYQYQSINKNTLQNLILQRIWASSFKTFNDPFEFVMRKNYWINNERKIEYLNPVDQGILEAMKEEISKFGVTSFSECKDNILLWSHYSSNHAGICLAFNIDEPHPINLFKVTYETELPNISKKLCDNCTEVLFTKGKLWEYEKEYRLVFEKVGHYNYPGMLCEIIFGCRTSEADMESVFKICDAVFENEEILSKAYIQANSFYLSSATAIRKKRDPVPKYYAKL